MNEPKLKRIINDASDLLDLNTAGREYLDVLINMVYNHGRLDEIRESQEEPEKTFKEKWEETRMK